MHRFKGTLAILSALIIAAFFTTVDCSAQNSGALRLGGSKYMFYVVTDLATSYMKKHTDLNIVVNHGDSDTGLKKVLEKNLDAGMSFRKLDEDEKQDAKDRGINIAEKVIGHGAVAIITNSSNPVSELTLEQLRKIFVGEINNWSQVGGNDEPVETITRDESLSGTEQLFKEVVLRGFPVSQRTVRTSDHDIVRCVRKQKGAIADARISEARRGNARGMVKIIAIKESSTSPAVMPTEQTVANKSYPIAGPLVMYYDENTQLDHLKKFVEFCAVQGLGPWFTEVK